MPLPDNNAPWPPPGWRDIYTKYAEWAAWWSGDMVALSRVYSSQAPPTRKGRFWAQEIREERRVMLHVPIASDIASTSADLLFSEGPTIRIPAAHEERSPDGARTAQDRLIELVEAGGVHNRLLEGAESAAALGGVIIGPVWDREIVDMPILRVAQVDQAIPEFRWGMLVACTLWHRLPDDQSGVVWRHLERHERGHILHGLYRGTEDRLGQRVPLSARPETAGLEDVIVLPAEMSETLAVRYVPNMRPSRLWRGNPVGQYLGRSDYAGSEGFMDALDEVYTSWQRDIRLGKARLPVPEVWLERRGDGEWVFDAEREIYAALNVDPMASEGWRTQLVQPEIRWEAHSRTCLDYLDRIISAAGYSPQSFGLQIEGRAESGTALRIRERKSLITRGKKGHYWTPAIEDALGMMLVIDRHVFGRPTPTDYRPSVELEDSIVEDVRERAESVALLRQAEAASIEVRVRTLHPDWSDAEVQAEVARIQAETGRLLPDPFQVGID